MKTLSQLENYNLLRVIGMAITPSEMLFCRDIRAIDNRNLSAEQITILYQEAYDYLVDGCDFGVDFLEMAHYMIVEVG